MGRMGFAARLPTKPGVRADINNQNLDTMSNTYELLTGEWLNAAGNKWPKREVLCRFSDGWQEVCSWNGFYWVDQNGHRVAETLGHRVTHFYIFEKFHEQNVID